MPIYEYKCANCGLFEKFEKITASPLTECPTCGGKVHRIISSTGVIFKGSGFYSTDNRSSNYKNDSSYKEDSSSKDNSSKDNSSKDISSKDISSKKSASKDESKAS